VVVPEYEFPRVVPGPIRSWTCGSKNENAPSCVLRSQFDRAHFGNFLSHRLHLFVLTLCYSRMPHGVHAAARSGELAHLMMQYFHCQGGVTEIAIDKTKIAVRGTKTGKCAGTRAFWILQATTDSCREPAILIGRRLKERSSAALGRAPEFLARTGSIFHRFARGTE
jgi:hypothetical protein